MPQSEMMLRRCGRLVIFILLLAGCCLVRSADGFTGGAAVLETGNNCLKPCVCKWKGGKESVTCHQAGFTEVPASGLEGTIQVCSVDLI